MQKFIDSLTKSSRHSPSLIERSTSQTEDHSVRVTEAPLPPEILLAIFDLLLRPIYEDTLRYVPSPPEQSELQDGSLRSELRRVQATLAACLRISRGWYGAGVHLLYGRIVLDDHRQFGLLDRTLRSNRDLANLAKFILLTDYLTYPPPPSIFPTPLKARKNKAWENLARSHREALFEALRACPALIALHIGEPRTRSSVAAAETLLAPLDLGVLDQIYLSGRLRALSLSGPYLLTHPIPPDAELPQLEELALQDAHLPPDFCLRTRLFPALRRLRLVRCARGGSDAFLAEGKGAYALHTVEAYYNQLDAGALAHGLAAHAGTLTRLVLVGKTELRTFAALVVPPLPDGAAVHPHDRRWGTAAGIGPVAFGALEELDLGLLALAEARAYDATMAKWRAPVRLHRLTLVRRRWSGRADVSADLRAMRAALEASRGQCPALTRVTLEGTIPDAAHAERAECLKMEEVCGIMGTEFIKTERDVADYITAQIVSAHWQLNAL